MPELPEIEVARQGISPHLIGNQIKNISIHTTKLRWQIPTELTEQLPGQTIQSVERRGKYLILHCPNGGVLVHLGMTGYLRILPVDAAVEKHDHFDMVFQNNILLRLTDVRRFGTVLWAGQNPSQHKLLLGLGLEPLSEAFCGDYLFIKSRSRRVSVKQFIMDSKVIAGVGNIYANEGLFHAGIRPFMLARDLSLDNCVNLARAIKEVLYTSIRVGGTMLDIRDGTEKTGYFPQQYAVYNRKNSPCIKCTTPIEYQRLGQRSIYYCSNCQL